MKKKATGLRCKRSFVIVTAVLVLVFAMTCISYAATDGQVFETIKVWINGEPAGEGSYTVNDDGSYSVKINEGDTITIEDGDSVYDCEAGAMQGSVKYSKESIDGEDAAMAEVIINEIMTDDTAADVADSGTAETAE